LTSLQARNSTSIQDRDASEAADRIPNLSFKPDVHAVVHVAAHGKDDFLATCLRMFDNAAEARVAVVTPLLPPVAAEGSERFGPKPGRPVVAEQKQPA
jgi:hypothetical protein